MLTSWETKKIRELFNLGRGRVISSIEIANHSGKYPVYSSQSRDNGCMGYIDTFDFDGEYVTWTTDGANAGTVFYRNGKFNCTNVCGMLKAKNTFEIDPRFTAFQLGQLSKRHVSYIGNPKLMNGVMAEIEVKKPPYPEQKTIAVILDTLDEAIAAAEDLLAKQEKMKQGLLQDLLSRGIDENGQLRPPWNERPDLYRKTEFGMIPISWSINLLDDFAIKIQDGTHFSPKTGVGHHLYITSKNIRFGFIDLYNVETIDETQHIEIYRRCDVKPGDLLLTKDGANTGNAAINTINEQISLLSSVAFIRFDSTKDIVFFHLQYLLSQTGQKRLKDLMSGNAITRLTLKKIRNFEVPRPTVTEQKMIAEILASADDEINTLRVEIKKLLLTKTGLMQDLLTGRRRVTPELIQQVEPLALKVD